MNIKSSLPLLAMVAVILCARTTVSIASETSPKPNVLFIAVDDLRPESGCYSVEDIKTPRIDAFAESGVTFNRDYCQLAVCNPSRVSVMAGLRPDSTRVWDLVTDFRKTISNALTNPQHFRKHGYHAVSYGKIFHNTFPDNVSWDEPHHFPENSRLWSNKAKRSLTEFRKRLRAEEKSEFRVGRTRAVATEIVDVSDSEHLDGAIASQAAHAIESRR